MPVRYGLIEPVEVSLPQIPPAMDRLRIAHLSDLHISRRGSTVRGQDRMDRLGNQLTTLRLDLVVFTGDYMVSPGDEEVAVDIIRRLCMKLRPNLGMFGVFGNHDTPAFREQAAELPIHWLHNETVRLAGYPIEIWGLGMLRGEDPDAVSLVLNHQQQQQAVPAVETPRHLRRDRGASASTRPLRLMLAHSPSSLTTASDLGMDLVASGHTHGGQIRLPALGVVGPRRALVNACDLPLGMSAGLLRHRQTIVAISRGLGEVGFPRRRLFCPPHAPLYTLHRRSTPGRRSSSIDVLETW